MSIGYKIDKSFYDNAYISKYYMQANDRLTRLVGLLQLSEDDVVADFACGNGLLADLIHGRVKEYHGVDYSEAFIAHANEKTYDNVTFYCQDIIEFCNTRISFYDVAFALDFSEHVTDNEFICIFSSIYKSLKPKGRLYLHTPNGAFILERLKSNRIMKQLPGHIAVRTCLDTCSLLSDVGFSSITASFLPHYLPQLSWLHFFTRMPTLRDVFSARLFISCEK